jgi:DNA-binding NarL/FixJ family response regulator
MKVPIGHPSRTNPANMAKPRLMLADDHTMVAEAFVRLLADDYDVVRVVSDGMALLKEAPELRPDVVILDLGMPLLNGMEAGKQLKKLLPSTKIIVLTMNEGVALAKEALRHWASAYLLKMSAGSELLKAVNEVLHHKTYVTPRMAQRLQEEFIRDPDPDHQLQLTQRQIEVLQLLVEGHSMKQAAAILNITARTVAFHKYRIMDHYGLRTHSDFVMFAIKHYIVESPAEWSDSVLLRRHEVL